MSAIWRIYICFGGYMADILVRYEKHGLVEPKIENYSGGFSITIFNDIYNEQYLSKCNLNDRQKEAMNIVKKIS